MKDYIEKKEHSPTINSIKSISTRKLLVTDKNKVCVMMNSSNPIFYLEGKVGYLTENNPKKEYVLVQFTDPFDEYDNSEYLQRESLCVIEKIYESEILKFYSKLPDIILEELNRYYSRIIGLNIFTSIEKNESRNIEPFVCKIPELLSKENLLYGSEV